MMEVPPVWSLLGRASSHQSPNTLGPGDSGWSSPAMGASGFSIPRSVSGQKERLTHPPHMELYHAWLSWHKDLSWGRCQQEHGG